MSKDNVRQIRTGLRKSPFIEVSIGEFEFKLPTNDSKRKEIMSKVQTMQINQTKLMDKSKKLEAAEDYTEAIAVYEEVNELTKEAIDLILGEGTFDQLYEATGEDIEAVLEAFIEVINQYNQLQQKSKLTKLVEAKKKKA